MLQAILVSIVAFLASIDEYTFGASMMGRPLFTGPIVGWILGDFQAGIMIGATLELMFMGSIMVPRRRYMPPVCWEQPLPFKVEKEWGQRLPWLCRCPYSCRCGEMAAMLLVQVGEESR